jgi:hypothetical protein
VHLGHQFLERLFLRAETAGPRSITAPQRIRALIPEYCRPMVAFSGMASSAVRRGRPQGLAFRGHPSIGERRARRAAKGACIVSVSGRCEGGEEFAVEVSRIG